MPRGVQQGNYPDALLFGIADDGVHLVLGQCVPIWVIIVRHVAPLDTGLHIIAGVGSTVHSDGHIFQQEAQAVVADRQFQIVIIVIRKRINDTLDLVHGEILSAAIQMENLHKGVIAAVRCFRKDGGRQ